MKDLDKAIINEDVKHIIFLFKNDIDFKGAVLMHLKEQLISEDVTEEALKARGCILNLADLKQAIAEYTDVTKESFFDRRNETYLKRLYSSLQCALKAWQQGKVASEDLKNAWDLEAITYLTKKWIDHELPKALMDYSEKKQTIYIDTKHQQWQDQSLDSEETQQLDSTLLKALEFHWFYALEDKEDKVVQKIKENMLEQSVNFYRGHNRENAFAQGIESFIFERIADEIYAGTINAEEIKDAIESEKTSLVKGKIVSDLLPYYKQATQNLLKKWKNNSLPDYTDVSVTSYIKKQLASYQVPNELSAALRTEAIQILLEQYKNKALELELQEVLAKQSEANIVGYYEKHAGKASKFRDELAQHIFSNLLSDWQCRELSKDDSTYLKQNLLSEVRSMIHELGLYSTRPTMFVEINSLRGEVNRLHEQVDELRAEIAKLQELLAKLSNTEVNTKEVQTEFSEAAQQSVVMQKQGFFKIIADSSSVNSDVVSDTMKNDEASVKSKNASSISSDSVIDTAKRDESSVQQKLN
ncbi:MAG: hypothetical protein JSS53_00950 [Proteobacteria bacterium]|nr:hypothetical protein [Pseudomonadota bacterium]